MVKPSALYTLFHYPHQTLLVIPRLPPDSADGDPHGNLLVGIDGGPTLIKDSTVHITCTEEVFWESGVGLDNADPRTAVGYTRDNHVIFFVVDGRDANWSIGVSLPQMATILLELGCIVAMNLDGGGSSQMAIEDQLINRPEGGTFMRPIPTILALVDKDSIPKPPTIYFEKIIDTGDPQCTLLGSGWFESANPGYWGNSKAMLNQIGNGEDYALFQPNLPSSTTYDVFAWWVHASNRCKDTPFVIYDEYGVDTVKIEQSKNGSQWIHIGSYHFQGDSTDQVIISDAAIDGIYIVADALRFISYDSSIATYIKHKQKPRKTDDFQLFQNFPNPFNPETTIHFIIDYPNQVSLKVFSLNGQEVASLIEGKRLGSGIHEVRFRGNDLSSGIYIYRLRIGNEAQHMKMVLLR
jgi:hypothetical protein